MPGIDLPALHRRLRRIDRRATDYDDNEYGAGLAAIAVAVDSTAAIGVIGSRPPALRRIAPRVRSAAAEIRAELSTMPR